MPEGAKTGKPKQQKRFVRQRGKRRHGNRQSHTKETKGTKGFKGAAPARARKSAKRAMRVAMKPQRRDSGKLNNVIYRIEVNIHEQVGIRRRHVRQRLY